MSIPYIKPDQATSIRMSSVSTANTSIEIIVRKNLHRLGFRFRLNNKSLPGSPDIVLKKYQAVIFVHGCFWHGHAKCKKGKIVPKRNRQYWEDKIARNKNRDKVIMTKLKRMGWRILVVWECELSLIENIIINFFKIGR